MAAPPPEDADQAIVCTPYGRALVTRTREVDGVREVQLLEWETERDFAKRSRGRRQEPVVLYTSRDYPSVTPRVGDDVVCQYGRGRVTKISEALDTDGGGDAVLTYTIALSSWRLGGRSTATCHVTSPPPRVVRKHTLSEMDAHEKVDLAQSQKAKATNYFSKEKNYKLALTTYASAVDAVRNVQHDHTSTNEVRADLVIVMVTCSNNAATCCVKLGRWEEANKFAKNALILLDALHAKRGGKIHGILSKEGVIDAKLFGEWRVKSYLIIARTCIEEDKVVDAVGVLKSKALGVAMGYIDAINAKGDSAVVSKEERASLKSLMSQVKEIKRLLAECSDKKKAARKLEQRRAKAMFGGDKENNPPSVINTGGEQQPQPRLDNDHSNRDKKSPASAASNGQGGSRQQQQQRQSSMKHNKEEEPSYPQRLSPKKAVSFSQLPPEVKEFESADEDNGDEGSIPWYSEHREALIVLAIAGFSATALMALRKSFR